LSKNSKESSVVNDHLSVLERKDICHRERWENVDQIRNHKDYIWSLRCPCSMCSGLGCQLQSFFLIILVHLIENPQVVRLKYFLFVMDSAYVLTANGTVSFSLNKMRAYPSPFRQATITKLVRTLVWFALNKVRNTLTFRSMQIGQVFSSSPSFFGFLYFWSAIR
jgi:hypothetical protein